MGALELLLDARHKPLGGFEVHRALPAVRRTLGPFALLDHSGPTTVPPGVGFAIPPHPHIGIATLSYLFQGELVHRDSLGSTQRIRPGEVNLMTAGRGIVHSERASPEFARDGGELHLLQLWVGLTAAHEDTEPAFQHLAREQLPAIDERGASLRLIGGTAYGLTSPLRVLTPQFYAELLLDEGAVFPMPEGHEERGAYVVSGSVEVDHQAVRARQLAFFTARAPVVLRAREAARVMLLGGAAIVPPRMWWNFVSSQMERIEQAKRDWAEGRFVPPPDDPEERVPLPGE